MVNYCDPPSPGTRVYCPDCKWRGQIKEAAQKDKSMARCPGCGGIVIREGLRTRSPHQ